MLDLTKPVQTRDGRKVIIDATDANFTGGKTISARVTERAGYEVVYTYMPNGSLYHCGEINHSDLINIPERVERWINVYPPNWHEVRSFHISRANADYASKGRIGVLRLVYENDRVVETQYIAIGGE